MTKQDVVNVSDTIVACQGPCDGDGHPQVFLKIASDTGTVTCPYCSRIFKREPNVEVEPH